jgi:hypothetical protein
MLKIPRIQFLLLFFLNKFLTVSLRAMISQMLSQNGGAPNTVCAVNTNSYRFFLMILGVALV